MQGETGSLHDLKRYHLRDHVLVSNKIIEESDNHESESDENDNENDEEHLARLREFQLKLLTSSNSGLNNARPRSGRRHTLCLTR